MHVAMAIDVVRNGAHGILEALQLFVDQRAQPVPIEHARITGKKKSHMATGRSHELGEIQVNTHVRLRADVALEPARGLGPTWTGRQTRGRRDVPGGDQAQDAVINRLVLRKVVGRNDQLFHRCKATVPARRCNATRPCSNDSRP